LARAIAHSTELKFVANRTSFLANLLEDGVYALDLIVSNKLLLSVDVCWFAYAYRRQRNRSANAKALLYSGCEAYQGHAD